MWGNGEAGRGSADGIRGYGQWHKEVGRTRSLAAARDGRVPVRSTLLQPCTQQCVQNSELSYGGNQDGKQATDAFEARPDVPRRGRWSRRLPEYRSGARPAFLRD